MKIFGANISISAADFLKDKLQNISTIELANELLKDTAGIISFFKNKVELIELKAKLLSPVKYLSEPDRAEYGDFQTNGALAAAAVELIKKKNINPEIVIEPTCGTGSFIIAAIQGFQNLKQIIGIEIYKQYLWETKFNILDFFINIPNCNKPLIEIIQCSVFDFDFKKISNQIAHQELLIIGNPPWVTNAQLGVLNSNNLPKKSNFKNHNGLDAITGKGNFDIAEYITLSLIDAFQGNSGHLALLVKNSLIKNVVFEQKTIRSRIGLLEKHCIDSKKEFNVSVEASLFCCRLNSEPVLVCNEFDFYEGNNSLTFGWVDSNFVSNTLNYHNIQIFDGICPFKWRQGLKHDCSSVMELEKINEHYINNLKESITIEPDLVYGLLKSSDLKNTVIRDTRKHTIVTQTKVGQCTNYLKHQYPQTFSYLNKHLSLFQERKSGIYKGKPSFSIFGIGDYSFKPYKVAISGLYKTFHFTLVQPQNGKPVMLDDTCYFIGFDIIEYAVYSAVLLNSDITKELLSAVTFPEAKRVFTKEILKRIDLVKIAMSYSQTDIEIMLNSINNNYELNVDLSLWDKYIKDMLPVNNRQEELFEQ